MNSSRRKPIIRNLFAIAVFILITAWLVRSGVRSLYPQIDSIPAVFSGDAIVIKGSGFGSNGRLIFSNPAGEISEVTSVENWSDITIRVQNPDLVTGSSLQVVTQNLGITFKSNIYPIVIKLPELMNQTGTIQVPLQEGSYWPLFRYDQRNTGSSPQPAIFNGNVPWMFQTGKGIFSTPVIDRDGTIYIGSADHNFYAISSSGEEKWRYTTGEMIDSAAILPADYLAAGKNTVILPSGDGFLYNLDLDKKTDVSEERVIWKFDARISPRASYNNWFEGNIAVGYDGTLYAGNTNFNYYAITPDGDLKWTYPTTSNNWSIAALDEDGTIYWASNDTLIRAVDSLGNEKWTTRTLGFIAASAAIGTDGTVYIGSFDSYLYALNPLDGRVLWKFKTNDHIYASVALGSDTTGNTNAIYFGSSDGSFYAVDPDGNLAWAYDTGDPIRSSAVLGADQNNNRDAIVYFGAGNGKLYALNTLDGSRRWSFDTTLDDPELVDRNDLNASPALGLDGIVIAGEAGQVWQIPYDYCLNVQDSRCSTQSASDLPENMTALNFVTPGGSVLLDDPQTLPISTMITLKLIVREQGSTLDAHFCNTPGMCGKNTLKINVSPDFDFDSEKSADGTYLYIRPTGFLEPETDYTITISGTYYTGGLSLGNLTIGGRKGQSFSKEFSFRTDPLNNNFPLFANDKAVSALEWTRLAVPIPAMMPSLNQIGFDSMDWIMAPVSVSQPDENGEGSFILWVIGGKKNPDGILVPDPESDFTLAFNGRYKGNNFIFENRTVTIPVTGIPIPFTFLEMRGQFNDQFNALPGTTLYADSQVMKIPTFGPYLVIAGLANNVYEKLLVSGTFIINPYQSTLTVNERPTGVHIGELTFTPPTKDAEGNISVDINVESGTSYPSIDHRAGILLVDTDQSKAIFLNYLDNLETETDTNGNLKSVTLNIPAGTQLPEKLEAYVMLDVFPVFHQLISFP